MTRRVAMLTSGLVATAALVACGSDGRGGGEPTITVFAASSLTGAFTEIAAGFETANPGATVELNFGSSSDLVDSITSGEALGTADVFASADEDNMALLVGAGDIAGDPRVFARNRAEIAVPAGNPAGVTDLEDFADEDLLLGACTPEAPCGAYAHEVFVNAGVTPSIDTEEAKVTDVVAKIASGELDAGIVYVTDVIANDDEVDGVEIPAEFNVDAVYPIATVAEAPAAVPAAAFVDYVLSDEGRTVLAGYGFLPPS